MMLKRRKLYIAAEFQLLFRPVSVLWRKLALRVQRKIHLLLSAVNYTAAKIRRNSKTVRSV